MNLRPDIHTAAFILIVAVLGIYSLRVIGGLLATTPGAESVGKAIVGMVG